MGPMAVTRQYQDGWWVADDGVRLHYRDYTRSGARSGAEPKSMLPVLCIPGLTRNARDFAHVADQMSGERRVIIVELRGRGESGSASLPTSYGPQTYLSDLEALLKQIKVKRFVAIGTSLGGIMTMLLAAAKPGRVAGALLNDVGPVIEEAGLDRIRAYVGKSQNWPTWIHAARDLANAQRAIYPDYDLTQWLTLAKRLYRLTPAGRIVPDYDMKIAEPMRQVPPQPAADLWPAFDALGSVPLTILRGGLSDILSAATAKDMVKRHPGAKLVTLPRVGHAPALDEPVAVKAIEALLKAVAG
jgi:pimeloyl-ACP methyl ester carboxylesterase